MSGPYHFCPLLSPSLHEMFFLVSLILLKRSLVFPILLFSSISLHWLLSKAFLSLLAILWNSSFRCLSLSFPLLFSLVYPHQNEMGRKPNGNQPWIFIRTDAEAKAPINLATWSEELTHWKRPWYGERLKAGREGGDRGWDCWMGPSTQWT